MSVAGTAVLAGGAPQPWLPAHPKCIAMTCPASSGTSSARVLSEPARARAQFLAHSSPDPKPTGRAKSC